MTAISKNLENRDRSQLCTPFELFLYAGALEIKNGMTVFVGFHWPFLIARIARKLHAPETLYIYENGTIEDENPKTCPTSPSDLISAETALFHGDCLDALYKFLPECDLAILDAPIVDARGNVNTTCVGNYHKPAVRLPGAGGGTEVGVLARKLLIVSTSKGGSRFPKRVDYVTSPAKNFYALITPDGKFGKTGDRFLFLRARSPFVSDKTLRENYPYFDTTHAKKKLSLPPVSALKVIHEEIKKAKTSHYILPT